jgi:hypothetical protein
MPSEKSLVRALDLVTIAPQGAIESLADAGAANRAKTVRNVVSSENVVAVGISEKVSDNKLSGILAVTFYVAEKKPLKQLRGDETIPPALALDLTSGTTVPTDIVEVGFPKLEPSPAALTHPQVQRKPIQPGFSVGHPKITAGTLGAIVRKNKKLYILSNSHVLANSGKGQKGDGILFPGKDDGGKLDADTIAQLEDFIAFQLGGDFTNSADCAIAAILDDRLDEVKQEIYKIGLPSGIAKPKRGMQVVKVGRTTGETVGEVKDVHFRMQIEYPNSLGKVGFLDQVFCSRYSMGGDSGALVLESDTMKAVGLHFAGFPDKKKEMGSVFNPIQSVLEGLKVTLVTRKAK